ncbi:MAG TPA: IS110 family transposase [Bryobacteraceae bacterium]|nr:IS110 family transposase [Bryobacteraceae bacterium]
MSESFSFFVGIDLGSEQHHIEVINEQGGNAGRRAVDHGGAAVTEFLHWLAQLTSVVAPPEVAVAVEAPRGALIDALLERGYAVFSINPKQLDRFRDRFSVAGAKDDRRDALVLAQSLRTDGEHFRRLRADDPRIVRVRELSRGEQSLQQDLRRACNQLWNYLQRYFPAVLQLSSSADEPWLWDLLRRCQALPTRAARFRPETIASLLRRHHIRRLTAEQVHLALREPLPLAPGVAEALAEQVLTLLPRLQLLRQQRLDLSQRVEQLIEELTADENFAEHRSLAILRSLPGVGRVSAAAVLAEAFTPLAEKDYRSLRALAGVAPVTKQSGKTRLVSMRRACDNRLRCALFHAANVHMQKDERARRIYHRLRQCGNSHARALRGVADRLLELLCTLLRKQSLYDPAKRLIQQQVPA